MSVFGNWMLLDIQFHCQVNESVRLLLSSGLVVSRLKQDVIVDIKKILVQIQDSKLY